MEHRASGMEQATVTKEAKQLTVEIVCVDCGSTRTVAVQDAKQVKRCVACQEKYRKVQRKEYRKNLVKDLREHVTSLEAQVLRLEQEKLDLESIINKQ
jgi:hypothetical protein